jgi:Fe-Mn family superoxide dismutase
MDHSTALAGAQPILALDMYEHSYHIDYGAQAAAYVDAFMAAAINWPSVAAAYTRLVTFGLTVKRATDPRGTMQS